MIFNYKTTSHLQSLNYIYNSKHSPISFGKILLKTSILISLLCICSVSIIYGQSSIKIYPKTIRLDKGKTRTITAVAFDSNGNYIPNTLFNFLNSSSNNNVASIRRSPEGNMEATNSRFSNNLGEITGLSAGTATFNASVGGVTSGSISVTVVDPAASPVAIVKGDNELTGSNNKVINARVGQAIEVSGELSSGVDKIEWSWGDGDQTKDLISATHAYLNSGSYQMKLKVTNTLNQSSESLITVNVSDFSSPTHIYNVSTASELLAAYNQCQGGEWIVIPAGTIITGQIQLPARTFSDFVTIKSSQDMPSMTVRSSENQAGMVTFKGSYHNQIPFIIKNKASKIRLSGLKFAPYSTANDYDANYYLLTIGETFGQSVVEDNPTNIIVDHCVINPPDSVSVVHAILNDGYKISFIGNWIGNIKTFGSQDSQAIFSLDGKGAHVYNNNFFEAASESIIYGGAENQIEGLVPTNVEFRRCLFFKRLSWKGLTNSVGASINEKNLFETKNVRRMYIEGCIMKNHWDALRSQYMAVVLKSATGLPGEGQGSLWAVSEEIVFNNTQFSHVNGGIGVARDAYFGAGIIYDTIKPQGIKIDNLLIDDMTFGRWGSARTWTFYLNGVDDFTAKHMTVVDSIQDIDQNPEFMMTINHIANFRVTISDSIFPLGYYGIRNSCGEGLKAFNTGTAGWFDPQTGGSCNAISGTYGNSWVFNKNVLAKNRSSFNQSLYPTNNGYEENYSGIKMNNYSECNISSSDLCEKQINDFALQNISPYKNQASDGKDPGIDAVLLDQRVKCTLDGKTSGCVNSASTINARRITKQDFDGDGKSDIGVYRPSEGNWYINQSQSGFKVFRFGASGDIPTSSDFDGDGKADISVYRPSNGTWYYLKSSDNSFAAVQFGQNGDLPRPADFDGDGKADISVFRPSNGAWYRINSSSGSFSGSIFGSNSDKPLIADFDGDGKSDLAVFRPSNSTFYWTASSNNGFNAAQFGLSTDIPTLGDFDGDGKTDIAVFRLSNGTWYRTNSSNGTFAATQFGQNGDMPVTADYDGDGKNDTAVFRPSTGNWYYTQSSNGGFIGLNFGVSTDNPIPAAFL